MPIEFSCPGCRGRLRVPDGTEGRLAQCPICGAQSPIPSGTAFQTQSPRWEQSFSGASGPDAPGIDQSTDLNKTFWSENSSSLEGELVEPSFAETTALPAWGLDWHRQYAYQRISSPANWLIGMSAIAFGLGLVSLFLVVLGMAAGGHQPGLQPVEPFQVDRSTPVFISMALGLLLDLMILFGSMKMKRLESYGWAMTAALLGVIPCTSPCCVLSMPFGLWALLVLTDPAVKAAFR